MPYTLGCCEQSSAHNLELVESRLVLALQAWPWPNISPLPYHLGSKATSSHPTQRALHSPRGKTDPRGLKAHKRCSPHPLLLQTSFFEAQEKMFPAQKPWSSSFSSVLPLTQLPPAARLRSHKTTAKMLSLEADRHEFKSQPCEPFLICKMWLITEPATKGHENYRR